MNEHEQTLCDVRAEVDRLPTEERATVIKIAGVFRQSIVDGGPMALMAFALIGAEMACHNGSALDIPQTGNAV